MSTNYRNSLNIEPRIFGGSYPIHTPAGTVYPNQGAPALPPRPFQMQTNYMPQYGIGSGMYGNSYGGMGGFGSLGGYGSYSGYGGGGYGNGLYGGGRYGGYGNMSTENRFIQIAEQSTRPAFESIESLVGAFANIATMLESTLFAFTSSFRAILGVAANFGHLRSAFGQFWTSFALFRGINYIFRKLLYILKFSSIDPKTLAFNEVYSAANGIDLPNAPYLIMKLVNSMTSTLKEDSKNPKIWVNPIHARVMYNFEARSTDEISVRAGQIISVAPKEIQTSAGLINSGWALASIDNCTSGLIPINYIQNPKTIIQPNANQSVQNMDEFKIFEQNEHSNNVDVVTS